MVVEKETLDFFGGDELRAKVFLEKYALRDEEKVLERTPEEMWSRIARTLAPYSTLSEQDIYDLLRDFKFVPGGRILFSVGNDFVRSTPFNCFFIPILEDSIEGIYKCAMEMARTYSFGGGVGTDISILRPTNSPVNNSARFSTGAVSFMDLYSLTTKIIGQAGRRGALMITIDDRHPDVLDFIKIKDDPQREKVRYANISVKVSDQLITSSLKNRDFVLEFSSDKAHIKKRVKAADIINEIAIRAHSCAEPGVIFWDRVKEFSNTEGYPQGRLMGTNPCSEQPLPAYGNCNLGAINLAYFALSGSFDWAALDDTVKKAVRFLDAIIDYAQAKSKYPLEQMEVMSLFERRVGLGIMGLADMFLYLNLKYDTDEAIEFAEKVMRRITLTAYKESVVLASERGSSPALAESKDGLNYVRKVLAKDDEGKHIAAAILKEGKLRNMTLTTIAPTGSIAILAGVSSGIEPIFAPAYLRRTESVSGGEFWVWHPSILKILALDGRRVANNLDPRDVKFPNHCVFAHQIEPTKRVTMQGALQKWVDSAISSTVNLPEHTTVDDVKNIIYDAWDEGCKGITVYREGSREGVLITPEHLKKKGVTRKPRPYLLQGSTFRMRCEAGNLYITINKDEEGNPFEIFLHLGKAGTTVNTLTEALGRLISLSLQFSVPPQEIVNQLSGIKAGENVVTQEDGEMTTSIPDAIALALEKSLGLSRSNVKKVLEEVRKNNHEIKSFDICPSCGGVIVKTGSCEICFSCGQSLCY